MVDVWTFGAPQDGAQTYSDGTTVPHRYQDVLLNGIKVGYVEIHLHERHGRDHDVDTSFGFTGVVYSRPIGGS